jgi:amidase
VAVATSLAGFGMGSQTGVSLYAPSTGASLVTLRGTDGIASGAGVMPLTWLQDFAGPLARTTSDIARILNATTGTDPDDLFTLHNNAGEKRPADYKTALDKNALKGKRIGYLPASFTGSPSYGQTDGTMEAVTARFADIEAYWTGKGWSELGPVKMSSRIDVPGDGGTVLAGGGRVGGMAWSQHTGISAVEVSVDDGPWERAVLGSVPSTDGSTMTACGW